MYTAYTLTEKSRKVLYYLNPPKYPEVIGHHITERFGIPEKTPIPKKPELVQVVGYFDSGDGIEGFLVEVNGSSKRPDGGLYHITWSLDRGAGYKPVHSNKFVEQAKRLSTPVTIEVTPELLN